MKKHAALHHLFTGIVYFCAAALVLYMQTAHADSTPPHCHYTRLASLPVETISHQIVVQGSINGKTAPMQIDTGAQVTLLTRQGVDFFGLPLLHSAASQLGVGGESMSYETVADDMALGKFHTRPHKRLAVAMDTFSSFMAIVGANILFNSDLELNLADHTMNFFGASDCSNTFLAYWNKDASDVALNENSHLDLRQVVTVEINGQKLRAMIDSGAQYSVINKAFAARLGITPESSGVKKIGVSSGIGTRQIDTWLVKFDSFSIGDETVKNPSIRMIDMWGGALSDTHDMATSDWIDDQPDMLLGADFLQAHRVLFALSQHRLYFSYIGGDVFPEPKPAHIKVSGETVKVVE